MKALWPTVVIVVINAKCIQIFHCHEFKWSRTKWIVQICMIVEKKKRWSRWQLERKTFTAIDTKCDRKSLAQKSCVYLEAIAWTQTQTHAHWTELNLFDSVILKHLQMLEIYRLMFRRVCRIEKVMNVIRISMEFVPFHSMGDWLCVCNTNCTNADTLCHCVLRVFWM